MSLTEQDLRDLLVHRTAEPPTAPGRAAAVERRVRRRRRRDATVVVCSLLLLVGAAIPVVRHVTGAAHPVAPLQSPSAPPSSAASEPTPLLTEPPLMMQTHVASAAGLRIATTGPQVVPGTGRFPFTVTVTLTNTTSVTWHGTVGVALTGAVVNYFGQPHGHFLFSTDSGPASVLGAHSSPGQADLVWFSMGTTAQRIEGLADPIPQVIGPGKTVTVFIGIVKPAYGFPDTDIRGWLPVLDPATPGVQPHYPNPASYPLITFK
jgi:hypothetical protein